MIGPCKKCAYWTGDRIMSHDEGLCLRRSPIPTSITALSCSGSFDTRWPKTNDDDKCGDFEPYED